MSTPSSSLPSSRLFRPAHWSRALLAVSFMAASFSNFAFGQTNPSPQVLPLNQTFGASTFTTLPAGFAAWNGVSGAAVTTQALAEASAPTGNATLGTATAPTTTGGIFGYASAGDAKVYVQTSGNVTSGVSQLAMALNTTALQDVVVGYTVDSISVQTRTIGVVCQYRVGTSGSWTTVTALSGSNPYSQSGGAVGLKTTVSATLPAAANNQPVVQLRWAFWRGTEAGNSAGLAIDNVTATASPLGGSDTIPPTLATLSPADGATGVDIFTSLQATFSEAVVAGTGTLKIFDSTGEVQSLAIPSAAVSISGATLTATLPTPLLNAKAYYVQISPGALTDAALNSFTGITDATTWNFTTIAEDVTPPTILTFSPANNATDIAPPTSLVITLSEPVQFPSFASMIYVKDASNATVASFESGVFSGEGIQITNEPVPTVKITIPTGTPLEYAKTYHVEFEAGAFEDLSGNPIAGFSGDTTWKFTTVEVPGLTSTPYTQNFAGYVSAATLPAGWSATAGAGYLSGYEGDWGVVSVGGFKGNNSVYGYHHTSQTLTTNSPLHQILTLRNVTGALITDLTVTYKGRVAVPANTRLPVYTVTVAGVAVPALGYTTSDPDLSQRNASVSGLSIPVGATFQVIWSSSYPTGAGSARQIGISDVFVNAASTAFPPTVAGLNVPVATIGSSVATVKAEVTGDGGQAVTARGFVYSVTSTNASPVIDGPGVVKVVSEPPSTGAYETVLSGLTSATNYTVRAYATSGTGTSYTAPVTFTTLAPPPTLVTTYTQNFAAYNGTNPTGWTALSDAVPPVQSYAGPWGTTLSTGGFLGGDSAPGVLGYRHTGNTGNLTVTLRLINGTGAKLTSLNVSYLGRVNDTEETRVPIWSVTVDGSAPIAALEYSTALGTDQTKTATVTGLDIDPGEEFSISWKSSRGDSAGSSKQIGLSGVEISTGGAPTNTLASWISGYNVGTETGVNGDYDRDGLANALENLLGSNPSVSNTGLGVVSGTSTSVTFRHTRSDSPASDLASSYEWSTNLGTWYPSGTGGGVTVSIGTPVVITNGTPNDLVEVTATITSGSASKLFVRLKATKP